MNRTRGSISIEAAITSFLFCFFMFLLFSFLQYTYVRDLAERVALSTAEDISKYSCILYKSGILNLKDKAQSKLISRITENNTISGNIFAELAETGFEMITDETFSFASTLISEEKLKQELENRKNIFDVELYSLQGSSFFENGSEFTISVTLKSDYLFPVIFGNYKGIYAQSVVKANGWLYGGSTRYTVDEINVWSLDNMKRGTVLNHVFNSNLPDKFPEIDIYDEKTGLVTKITSIDFTLPTYDTEGKLKDKILLLAKNLSKWNGGSYTDTVVLGENIKSREMILVIPDNELTPNKMREIFEASSNSISTYGVKITLETYQHSYAVERK